MVTCADTRIFSEYIYIYMYTGSQSCYSNKEIIYPELESNRYSSFMQLYKIQNLLSCVGVASTDVREGATQRIVTRQQEVVPIATPTKKHSLQRNRINSLADNARRCFKLRNKCACCCCRYCHCWCYCHCYYYRRMSFVVVVAVVHPDGPAAFHIIWYHTYTLAMWIPSSTHIQKPSFAFFPTIRPSS